MRNTVTVLLTASKGLQDEQVKRALPDFDAVLVTLRFSHRSRISTTIRVAVGCLLLSALLQAGCEQGGYSGTGGLTISGLSTH